ncbi:hypothetical protein XENORESO_005621 [Xenotaenia resolanae]|uniref:UMA domain-containing protein n=1 Tax=Xenotaenia resolanae TaxID=208358 RepID=A0ABV0X3W8_9TELE
MDGVPFMISEKFACASSDLQQMDLMGITIKSLAEIEKEVRTYYKLLLFIRLDAALTKWKQYCYPTLNCHVFFYFVYSFLTYFPMFFDSDSQDMYLKYQTLKGIKQISLY